MPNAAVEVQQPNPTLTGYAELTAAFQMIREIRVQKLRWQPEAFNEILYVNTELARPTPRTGFISENEVLMKNVYFLATKTQNVTNEFVMLLVDSEVLSEEEGNLIMGQPTNKLRAIKLYSLLVEKEDPDFSLTALFVGVLQDFNNFEAVEIIAHHFKIGNHLANPRNAHVDEPPQGNAEGRQFNERAMDPIELEVAGALEENPERLEDGNWTCRFCTFVNSEDVHICEVCGKTEDFDLIDSMDVNICPQCTLLNEDGSRACDACGFLFVQGRPSEHQRRVLSDSDYD